MGLTHNLINGGRAFHIRRVSRDNCTSIRFLLFVRPVRRVALHPGGADATGETEGRYQRERRRAEEGAKNPHESR